MDERIVFVIGPTGVGKTKLSIEIAKKFDGEIINVDSLQAHTGLDIITCKPSSKEQCGVPHHLFSFIPPEKDFKLNEFVNLVLSKIKVLFDNKKVPIVVGGTNLYVEALLYDIFAIMESNDTNLPENSNEVLNNYSINHPNDLYRAKNYLLKQEIKNIDRKVFLRFTNHFIIFVNVSDPLIYKEMLIERSKKLIFKDGGIEELFNIYNQSEEELILSKRGVYKAIGVCEFYEFFRTSEKILNIDPFNEKIDQYFKNFLKQTLFYSKKQLKWIKNRILSDTNLNILNVDMIKIDYSYEKQKSLVSLLEKIFKFIFSPHPLKDEVVPYKLFYSKENNKINTCISCSDFQVYGNTQWKTHLKSRRHRRNMKKNK